MSVGEMASFISTVNAPPKPRSSAVTGSPSQQAGMGCQSHADVSHFWHARYEHF